MSRRISILLLPAVVAACLLSAFLAAPGRANPRNVLPPATTVKGWKMVGQPRAYSKANLFDLINGEAEAVTRYAFSGLSHAEYAPAGSSAPALTIDVYDMGDALNAFGLFSSSDRGSGAKVAIGAEGVRIGDSGLNFWKGRYVVRTTLIGRGAITPANRNAQSAFARAAANRITGSTSPPALLSALPTGNRQAGSERYVRTNVLGLSFLRNAVTARYPSAGTGAEVFVAQYPSAAQAKSAYNDFRAREKTGTGLAAWKIADGGFTVRDRYMRDIAVVLKGRHVVGAVRARNAATAKSLAQQATARVK